MKKLIALGIAMVLIMSSIVFAPGNPSGSDDNVGGQPEVYYFVVPTENYDASGKVDVSSEVKVAMHGTGAYPTGENAEISTLSNSNVYTRSASGKLIPAEDVRTDKGTQSAINTFTNPSEQKSSHAVISRTGQIFIAIDSEGNILAQQSTVAYHAREHNTKALGVEFSRSREEENSDAPLTPQQQNAMKVTAPILAASAPPGIPVKLISHEQLSPGRREDGATAVRTAATLMGAQGGPDGSVTINAETMDEYRARGTATNQPEEGAPPSQPLTPAVPDSLADKVNLQWDDELKIWTIPGTVQIYNEEGNLVTSDAFRPAGVDSTFTYNTELKVWYDPADSTKGYNNRRELVRYTSPSDQVITRNEGETAEAFAGRVTAAGGTAGPEAPAAPQGTTTGYSSGTSTELEIEEGSNIPNIINPNVRLRFNSENGWEWSHVGKEGWYSPNVLPSSTVESWGWSEPMTKRKELISSLQGKTLEEGNAAIIEFARANTGTSIKVKGKKTATHTEISKFSLEDGIAALSEATQGSLVAGAPPEPAGAPPEQVDVPQEPAAQPEIPPAVTLSPEKVSSANTYNQRTDTQENRDKFKTYLMEKEGLTEAQASAVLQNPNQIAGYQAKLNLGQDGKIGSGTAAAADAAPYTAVGATNHINSLTAAASTSFQAGNYEAAFEDYSQAADVAKTSGKSNSEVAQLSSQAGHMAMKQGEELKAEGKTDDANILFSEAYIQYLRAQTLTPVTDNALTAVRYRDMGLAKFEAGRYDEASSILISAAEEAEQAGDKEEMALVYSWLGKTADAAGNSEDAIGYFERAGDNALTPKLKKEYYGQAITAAGSDTTATTRLQGKIDGVAPLPGAPAGQPIPSGATALGNGYYIQGNVWYDSDGNEMGQVEKGTNGYTLYDSAGMTQVGTSALDGSNLVVNEVYDTTNDPDKAMVNSLITALTPAKETTLTAEVTAGELERRTKPINIIGSTGTFKLEKQADGKWVLTSPDGTESVLDNANAANLINNAINQPASTVTSTEAAAPPAPTLEADKTYSDADLGTLGLAKGATTTLPDGREVTVNADGTVTEIKAPPPLPTTITQNIELSRGSSWGTEYTYLVYDKGQPYEVTLTVSDPDSIGNRVVKQDLPWGTDRTLGYISQDGSWHPAASQKEFLDQNPKIEATLTNAGFLDNIKTAETKAKTGGTQQIGFDFSQDQGVAEGLAADGTPTRHRFTYLAKDTNYFSLDEAEFYWKEGKWWVDVKGDGKEGIPVDSFTLVGAANQEIIDMAESLKTMGEPPTPKAQVGSTFSPEDLAAMGVKAGETTTLADGSKVTVDADGKVTNVVTYSQQRAAALQAYNSNPTPANLEEYVFGHWEEMESLDDPYDPDKELLFYDMNGNGDFDYMYNSKTGTLTEITGQKPTSAQIAAGQVYSDGSYNAPPGPVAAGPALTVGSPVQTLEGYQDLAIGSEVTVPGIGRVTKIAAGKWKDAAGDEYTDNKMSDMFSGVEVAKVGTGTYTAPGLPPEPSPTVTDLAAGDVILNLEGYQILPIGSEVDVLTVGKFTKTGADTWVDANGNEFTNNQMSSNVGVTVATIGTGIYTPPEPPPPPALEKVWEREVPIQGLMQAVKIGVRGDKYVQVDPTTGVETTLDMNNPEHREIIMAYEQGRGGDAGFIKSGDNTIIRSAIDGRLKIIGKDNQIRALSNDPNYYQLQLQFQMDPSNPGGGDFYILRPETEQSYSLTELAAMGLGSDKTTTLADGAIVTVDESGKVTSVTGEASGIIFFKGEGNKIYMKLPGEDVIREAPEDIAGEYEANKGKFKTFEEAKAERLAAEAKQAAEKAAREAERKRWAAMVYKVINPGTGARAIEGWLEDRYKDSWFGDLTSFNRTKLLESSSTRWMFYAIEGYEKKLCEGKMSKHFISDYPGRFISGSPYPDMGAMMYINAKKVEYEADFNWSEEVKCKFNGEDPNWFPEPISATEYQPLGYLYKLSWHIARAAPESTLYTIKMYNSNPNNLNSNCKINDNPVGEDMLISPKYNASKTYANNIADYKLAYYDRICIVFDSWKYDKQHTEYPPGCNQEIVKTETKTHGTVITSTAGTAGAPGDFTAGGSSGGVAGTGTSPQAPGQTNWFESGDI